MAGQLAQVMPRGSFATPATAAFFQVEQGNFDLHVVLPPGLGFDKDMFGIATAMLPARLVQPRQGRRQLLQHRMPELGARRAGVALFQADKARQRLGHQQRLPMALLPAGGAIDELRGFDPDAGQGAVGLLLTQYGRAAEGVQQRAIEVSTLALAVQRRMAGLARLPQAPEWT